MLAGVLYGRWPDCMRGEIPSKIEVYAKRAVDTLA